MAGTFNHKPFIDATLGFDFHKIRRGLISAAIVVIAIVGISSFFYTVQPEGKAVVKRFGKVIKIAEPGLHFKLPFGIDLAYFVPTERVLKEEFGFRTEQAGRRSVYHASESLEDESLMLTGDLNVINVEWVVQYRILDPDKFLHKVREQSAAIRDVSEAVMRRIVGNRLGSDVLTVGRVEIAALAKSEIQEILDSYDMGIHVTTIQLQDVNPPNPVKPAFNEVNEAQQEKERLINEAEKRRNQEVPKVQGEAMEIVSEAQGYAARRVNLATGEAGRFKAIYAEYAQAPEVTRRRLYIETMEKALGGVQKIYVIQEGGVAPLPLLNLDNGRLQRQGSEPK